MGKLYLVGTPIGNLGDITFRAIDILRKVDMIVCEDTRVTGKLLSHYEIKKPLQSYHDHSRPDKLDHLLEKMIGGASLAYVTDSGMPLISDPGYPLVRGVIEKGIELEIIPGPVAAVSALTASGLPSERFVFEGFLPVKSGGKANKLKALADEERSIVIYESPHRIVKTLEAIYEQLGDRRICLAREITKKFEEYLRGTVQEVITEVKKRTKLGELVIVIEGKNREKKSKKRGEDAS